MNRTHSWRICVLYDLPMSKPGTVRQNDLFPLQALRSAPPPRSRNPRLRFTTMVLEPYDYNELGAFGLSDGRFLLARCTEVNKEGDIRGNHIKGMTASKDVSTPSRFLLIGYHPSCQVFCT